VSANGIRCRYFAITETASLCKHHLASNPNDPVTMDSIWGSLAEKGGTLDTPKNVKDSLSVIFYSLAEGKMTERRAGIFCYILQSVLHAQRLISEQEKTYLRNGKYDLRKILPACFFTTRMTKRKVALSTLKVTKLRRRRQAPAQKRKSQAKRPCMRSAREVGISGPASVLWIKGGFNP
jgi:hypothetical protein